MVRMMLLILERVFILFKGFVMRGVDMSVSQFLVDWFVVYDEYEGFVVCYDVHGKFNSGEFRIIDQ